MARPMSDEWLELVTEPVVDPDQWIIDPHHHLWPPGGVIDYPMTRLLSDLSSGHRVLRTVFVECGAAYRVEGPEWLAPVGESEFVARAAREPGGDVIGGLVAHADLADHEHLDEILQAHEFAAEGLLRGIRDEAARDDEPALRIPGPGRAGQYANASFRAGAARLAEHGLVYDAWHYHHQNGDFLDFCRAVPGTTIVLDHLATPLGVGRYEGRRDEIFEQWRRDLSEIASCANVVAKLGGLAMPDNGFRWHRRDVPPNSDELLATYAPYYEHALACFGAARCMFESNFPVDRVSASYRVLWNSFKKFAAPLSAAERHDLFVGTATRTYRLDVPAT